MTTTLETFGDTLRWWRSERRYSQMQLAADAEVSTRHISFLETGKAKPSREMVIHLAGVLDVPLRDRNRWLHAAGFSPLYPETTLDAPAMDDVRSVLSTLLDAHMPNPAAVVDRRGDLVDANAGAMSLLANVVEPTSEALGDVLNLNRLGLHPDGVRPRTRNWHALGASLIQRLEREVHHRPADEGLAEFFEEMVALPDVDALRRQPMLPTGSDLVVSMHTDTLDGREVRLITTIATIGAPYDVTLEELRFETFFPTDDATRAVLAEWAAAG